MTISETTSPHKPPRPWPPFGEMTWLGMIGLGILALHILAAMLVLPAPSGGSPALLEDAKASLTD